MRKQRLVLAIAASSCMTFATSATAQPASLMIDAGPCLLLDNAAQRYTCYELQVENALTGALEQPASVSEPQSSPNVSTTNEAAPPTATIVAPAAVASETASPSAAADENFGFREAPLDNEEAAESGVHSVIKELQETLPNRYVITLENGQVWRQTRARANFRIRAGHHAHVYESTWGDDFRMGIEELNGSFIQVERVR